MGIREQVRSTKVLLVAAALVAAGIGFWIGRAVPTSIATPDTLQGTVTLVGGNGDEFAVDLDGHHGSAGESFALGSAVWKDSGDTWHFSHPIDCLKPLSTGQHIKFGVIHTKDPAFGTDLVAWVDCSNAGH